MWNAIITYIKSMVADPNGLADDARLCALLLVFTFIGGVLIDLLINHNKFEPQAYGLGSASLCGGVGAWFLMRGGK
jgi:hypothetical protein